MCLVSLFSFCCYCLGGNCADDRHNFMTTYLLQIHFKETSSMEMLSKKIMRNQFKKKNKNVHFTKECNSKSVNKNEPWIFSKISSFTAELPNLLMFYAISLCCLSRNCFPWNANLGKRNKHTFSNKTFLPE